MTKALLPAAAWLAVTALTATRYHHHHQLHSSPSAYSRQQQPQRREQQEDQQSQQPTLDSVWKACAYGDLEAVQSFCEEDKTLVNRQDGGGYSALQWAALNNRPAVTSYLIDQGAALNAQVMVHGLVTTSGRTKQDCGLQLQQNV